MTVDGRALPAGPKARASASFVVLVVASLLLATLSALSDLRQQDRFPALTAAQGAFFIEGPYEAFVAMGRLAPGASYVLLEDPDTDGTVWGGSRLWIEEQLIGAARAREVRWLGGHGVTRIDVGTALGTRRWEGYSTLLKELEVLLLDDEATLLVVGLSGDRSGTSSGRTVIIDVRLLDDATRAQLAAAGVPS